jgi:hypothetical protein
MTAIAVMMAGGSAGIITFTNQTLSDTNAVFDSTAYQINRTNGNIEKVAASSGTTTVEAFVNPTSAASAFEARCVQNSGTAVTGSALSSFIDLGTTSPIWTLTAGASPSSVTANLSVTIREKANTANSVTRTIVLNATVP